MSEGPGGGCGPTTTEATKAHTKLRPHTHQGAFGGDRFGILSERFARFFGTPRFILVQTLLVIVWITVNVAVVTLRWDAYPFILLNLAFSTQAAYAAPLILLAQTRQADRDKLRSDAFDAHRAELDARQARYEAEQARVLAGDAATSAQHTLLLSQNTAMTTRIAELTEQLHAAICRR